VLIVEDDDDCRALIVDLLERIGCTPHEATTGQQALALTATTSMALVLLDVSIPGITGYEVCHELRETFGQTLPIIFISGTRIDSKDRVAGLLIGADDYIVKPFDPDELLARVRRLLLRNSKSRPRTERRKAVSHPLHPLTPRQQEILVLLARGHDQTQIATELHISSKTVATHIQRLLPKLGVHSRAEAVAVAHQQRLLRNNSAP
jgi:DNA-binding NarL/FixJ family response regulator